MAQLPPALTAPRGDANTWGVPLDVNELAQRLRSCTTAVDQAKGAELEQLALWLFPHVDRLRVTHADVHSADGSQEVDLAVWNEDTPWSSFGPVFVVECKNWDRKVGSAEVAWFDWKMRLGGVTTGILLSAEGVTGDVRYLGNARAIIARANQDGRQILVVTFDDLAGVDSTEGLIDLLIRKRMDLVVGVGV